MPWIHSQNARALLQHGKHIIHLPKSSSSKGDEGAGVDIPVGDRQSPAHNADPPDALTDRCIDTRLSLAVSSRSSTSKTWCASGSTAAAPYLYNTENKTFITYNDAEAEAARAAYVKKHHLGGIMFWQYSGDPHNTLLDAIDIGFDISAS